MFTSQTQTPKTPTLEKMDLIKSQDQEFIQISDMQEVQTLNLIDAIKQNNQIEFFRALNLKTDSFGKNIIDEVDLKYKSSPLYWAAAFGYIHFIAPLVEAGMEINKQNKNGVTPIWMAAYNGYAEVIDALKAAGANVEISNKNGTKPVHAAALNGHSQAIAALNVAGANVNASGRNGVMPIYIAAQRGHAAAITALKAAGANVNTPNKSITPIFVAAAEGHVGAITALLAAGADASIKTKWGTALKQASLGKKLGHPEVVRLLEAHFKKYPKGINLLSILNKKNDLAARQSSPPVLKQFYRLAKTAAKAKSSASSNSRYTCYPGHRICSIS